MKFFDVQGIGLDIKTVGGRVNKQQSNSPNFKFNSKEDLRLLCKEEVRKSILRPQMPTLWCRFHGTSYAYGSQALQLLHSFSAAIKFELCHQATQSNIKSYLITVKSYLITVIYRYIQCIILVKSKQ